MGWIRLNFDERQETIHQRPDTSRIANVWKQQLPKGESHIEELVKNMKGDAAIMGLEQTLRKIRRKERYEGKLEGKLEGKIEGKEEVAKRMIDLGVDAAIIAAATGFSPDKIDRLRDKSH